MSKTQLPSGFTPTAQPIKPPAAANPYMAPGGAPNAYGQALRGLFFKRPAQAQPTYQPAGQPTAQPSGREAVMAAMARAGMR